MGDLDDFHRDFLPRFINAQRAFHDGDAEPNIAGREPARAAKPDESARSCVRATSTVALRTNLFLWREDTVWRCCRGPRWPAESWRADTTTLSRCPRVHGWNAAGAKARSGSVSRGAASRWPERSRWRRSVV